MESPSPISIGPFDVLSYIFEICGEEDYRTSLKIAVVSRHWRDIVLSTPRAWAFVDIETCTDDEIVGLYLQRSGQQPLHIFLPYPRSFKLLTNVAERLQCLSIANVPYGFNQATFPNVARLRIYGEAFPPLVSILSVSRFPALRHLLSENKWEPSVESVSLPPLQSLSLVVDPLYGWLRILTDCKDTLTSLRLHLITDHAILSVPPVRLPILQCLEVQYGENRWGHVWPLELKTPVLTTYIERGRPPECLPLQLDFESVTYMRMNWVPPLDALPNLRELQLDCEIVLVGVVFKQLLDVPTRCPELTLIYLGVEWIKLIDKIEQRLIERNTRPTPIRLTSTPRESDTPGIILHSVRDLLALGSFRSSGYSVALDVMQVNHRSATGGD